MQIQKLEDELGIELFLRKGKRLLGLTEPGRELVGIVNRILLDANNITNWLTNTADVMKAALPWLPRIPKHATPCLE